MASKILCFGMGAASTIIFSTLNSIYAKYTSFETEITVKNKDMKLLNQYFEKYLVSDTNNQTFQMAPALQWCWDQSRFEAWGKLEYGKTYRIKCYGNRNDKGENYPKIYSIEQK